MGKANNQFLFLFIYFCCCLFAHFIKDIVQIEMSAVGSFFSRHSLDENQ